ncbi:hypothetical protein CTZ27_30990 [Streptomyces griseocarneus]|nr:hypothetical protein CTZ27_30990 [Streptomyces griseocarneus]
MNLSQWALPAGLALAAIGAVAAVAMVIRHLRRNSEQNVTAKERAELDLQRRQAWRRRLAVIALAVGCLMMFLLAGIAAWLSFGAQREYAHAHNGGNWDAATGFAMLLDAGALSLSLIRFFEALTARSSGLTRLLLFLFVASSAQMNFLHAPEAGAGGAFLAVVPPLVYAVLLEMLLVKIEQVVMGRNKPRKADHDRGYSLLLWVPWPIGSPYRMWKKWRTELLATINNVRAPGVRPAPDVPAEPGPKEPYAPPATPEPVVPERVLPASTEPALAGVMLEKSGGTQPLSVPVPEPVAVVPSPETAEAMGLAPTGPPPSEATAYAPIPLPAPMPALSPVPKPVTEPEPATGTVGAAGLPVEEAEQEPSLPAVEQAVEAVGPETAEAGAAEEPDEAEEPAEAQDSTGAQTATDTGAEPAQGSPGDDGAAPGEGEAEDGQEPVVRHERPAADSGDEEEVREHRRVQIDLSSLPKDEGPRQLAERIYVAHFVAGLPLDRGDLARWAGYKSHRSGGNEYRRLEGLYGPILTKDGAEYLDLDWSSLEQHADTLTGQNVT